MANILRVTTPQVGYDNSNAGVKNSPTTKKDLAIQYQAELESILGEQNQGEIGTKDGQGYFRESNFGNFLNMIKTSPQVTTLFSKLLFSEFDTIISSEMNLEFSEEISQFLDSIQQSPESAYQFVKEQLEGNNQFQGEFFQKIRLVLNQTDSVELRTLVLDFMKRYVDMISGEHLLKQMFYNLDQIEKYMFRADKEALEQLMTLVNMQADMGDTKENSQVLKQSILSFLGAYIKKTHDFGPIRDQIALFASNLARYENGDAEQLLKLFQQLKGYRGFYQEFGALNEFQLMELLKEKRTLGKTKSHFFSVLKEGLNGAGGMENRQVFEDMLHSFLLNESVYMPLFHTMIPMEMFGRRMMSEIWIDPDELSVGSQKEGRRMRIFLKLDIEQIGNIDVILLYEQSSISAQIICPERLKTQDKEIQEGIGKIMERNGISMQNLKLDYSGKEKQVSEVFKKLYEGKKGVNVRI